MSSPQHGNATVSESPRILAAFLKLPNLELMYFRGMQISTDDDRVDDIWKDIFASSSNRVKDFYLDDPGDPSSGNLTRALCSSFRQLRSFTVMGGEDQHHDFDFFPSCLKIHNAQTLEKLVLYSTRPFHGYRCTMYRPEELRGYHNLKHITVDVEDVLLDAYYDEPEQLKHNTPSHIFVSDHDFFVEWIQRAFPPSLEVLVFQSDRRGLNEADADYVDDRLVAMIESGNFNFLKAIYL